jgi:hypothetical protein
VTGAAGQKDPAKKKNDKTKKQRKGFIVRPFAKEVGGSKEGDNQDNRKIVALQPPTHAGESSQTARK